MHLFSYCETGIIEHARQQMRIGRPCCNILVEKNYQPKQAPVDIKANINSTGDQAKECECLSVHWANTCCTRTEFC